MRSHGHVMGFKLLRPSVSHRSPFIPFHILYKQASNLGPRKQKSGAPQPSLKSLKPNQQKTPLKPTLLPQGFTTVRDIEPKNYSNPKPILTKCTSYAAPKPLVNENEIHERAGIIGKNCTNDISTAAGCGSVLAPFDSNVKLYFPHEQLFMYLRLYLFFCATPVSGSGMSVKGVIHFSWLLSKNCTDHQIMNSTVRLQDVDAPSFFIDQSPPESPYLERPNQSVSEEPKTAELRPLEMDLIPTVQLNQPRKYCISSREKEILKRGAYMNCTFALKMLHHSNRYNFQWQLQLAE